MNNVENIIAEARKRGRIKNRKGMTLVEILIVLSILAAIMVTVGVVAFNQLDNAKKQETKVKLGKIAGQVQTFATLQTPPALPDSLQDLVEPPDGLKPLLKESDTKDAWGQDIAYNKKGNRSYELRSPGADGQDGNEDDVFYEE
jgi:general secretion pathway protein G